ncbi:DUF1800 family protein [Lewinella sp. 4G2]|uniref:DUF1800 domain-containing protein n=1 Tax=Lewinella sp. 4G2 TaxID=1803372 RepID=UPI0007B4DC1D|nr:DUF1800 domain-containing protein [Lewinella sp. 4G2]OAV44881.1 hypothetical protein A3850_010430 [Lewinella sp. 4G2]
MTKMNRRAFFRPLSKQGPAPVTAGVAAAVQAPVLSSTGLAPYTGPWTKQEAGHLLTRAMMGHSYAQLNEAVGLGIEGTLDTLLSDLDRPADPLITSRLDGGGAVGETWIDKPYAAGDNLMRSVVVRIRSLYTWLGKQMLTEGMSARQTMALFWHDHFAITGALDPKYNYRYLTTIYNHIFGDFRQLVKEMTIEPLMLTFLNGNQNTVAAPNENYARELLELFTLGKGPQVGEGDYTHYTEQDVVAMAKSLTGWTDYGYNSSTIGEIGSRFRAVRHDRQTVQLSHRFGNQTFASSGEDTYARLVDLILEQDEVARFMARNIYRWFVYYDITPEIEANVIEPMANIFRESNYQMKPMLRALLSSEHFFDVLSQGPMIKHPKDFVLTLLRGFEVKQDGNARALDSLYTAVSGFARDLGMTYFTPPNVAGWKAFYQEPLYYRAWINSATLPLRLNYARQFLRGLAQVQGFGALEISLLDIVRQFPDPGDVYAMIDEWALFIFPRPIPEAQREFLKETLLPGLPDTQWAVEWAELNANPNDDALAQALENKLIRMLVAMVEMPEYQLS